MLENHAFAAIESAHVALARYKDQVGGSGKEAGRALAMVATKLDEARLWLDEAVAKIEEAQVAEAVAPR
jgi:hypothetical protein